MKTLAFRFYYRQVGEWPWRILTSALNTRDGASELVSRWNRKDKGRWQWKMEECLPTDFDYPLRKP